MTRTTELNGERLLT